MNFTRIRAITLSFYFIFFVIICRLFYWQVIKHDTLSHQVLQQSYKIVPVNPTRGEIFDSTHRPIALNQINYQVSLYKPGSKDINKTLSTLASAYPAPIDSDQKLINQFLANSNLKWITLSHLFKPDEIALFNDPAISTDKVITRSYPEKVTDGIITGFLGKNDNGDITGYGGLEGYYHKILTGRAGFEYQSQDAIGQVLITDKNWSSPPVNGRNLITTINPVIQYQASHILTEGISKYQAESGSIIVLDSATGAVLAMTSLEASSSASVSNRIITDTYEPGSIFKPLVMSMALDNHSLSPDWICTGCSQPRVIGQYTITNWDKTTHPSSTIQDIIKNSDNIGMSYIIDRLGLPNFQKYFSQLGLTHKTGIDLQGESRPPQKAYWSDIDLATAGFGQGFAITQIQMVTAFNAIANNGKLVKPYLVSAYEDGSKTIPINLPPPKIIFQENTTKTMKSILHYAVENSPVAQFKPKELDVCAKSGTAQVSVQGSYSDSEVTASYVGFSPCNNPKFTILVTLNRPKASLWGSSTSAPLWFELANIINPLL